MTHLVHHLKPMNRLVHHLNLTTQVGHQQNQKQHVQDLRLQPVTVMTTQHVHQQPIIRVHVL
jgi:hypothetical protein